MSDSLTANRGPQVVSAAAAIIVLSTIAVGFRVWSRALSKKAEFWWDDWAAIAAWVSALPRIIYCLYSLC